MYILYSTEEELAVLKTEFSHHTEKLDEYEQMRKEIDRLEGKCTPVHTLSCAHNFLMHSVEYRPKLLIFITISLSTSSSDVHCILCLIFDPVTILFTFHTFSPSHLIYQTD